MINSRIFIIRDKKSNIIFKSVCKYLFKIKCDIVCLHRDRYIIGLEYFKFALEKLFVYGSPFSNGRIKDTDE